MRSRGGGEIGGEIEQRDRAARCCDRRAARCYDQRAAWCCDRRSVRCDRRTGAQSVVAGEVSSSSLFAIWALSLSLSFRKYFEVKMKM